MGPFSLKIILIAAVLAWPVAVWPADDGARDRIEALEAETAEQRNRLDTEDRARWQSEDEARRSGWRLESMELETRWPYPR